jgi:hypothetical protein
MESECWIVEVQALDDNEYKTVAVFLDLQYAFVLEHMLNQSGGYGDIRIEKRVCDIVVKSGYL